MASKNTSTFVSRFIKFLSSDKFFFGVVGLFVLEALWIALWARYPQAFDEQFHFGLIKVHAQQLSPILTYQPPSTEILGAYTRDPSFLYHYLMSFPYRLVTHFTSDMTIQVLWLRGINVALFASSLVLLRKILSFSSASRAMIHTCILFFILIPVVPMVAAEINYDNLFIVLTCLAFLWCLQLRESKGFNLRLAIQLILLGAFTSMVKYAFLPMLVAICGYIIYKFVKSRPVSLAAQARVLSRTLLVIYGLLLIVGGGLFIERYGVNMVKYASPIPECNQVLSVERCQLYGPWARNYQLTQLHESLKDIQLVTYPAVWVSRMMEELTFVISSGFNANGSVVYWSAKPLPVPSIMAWGVLYGGIVLIIFNRKRLAKEPILRFTLLLGGAYTLALFAQNFRDYMHVHRVVAVHGRYLLPFIPALLLAVLLSLRQFLKIPQLRTLNSPQFKVGLAVVVALVFVTQGGGDVTYITRSQPRWFWSQSQSAQKVNADVQKALQPFVLGV